MRNMRGAFGALLMAGAAYAWKNRERLSQQFNSLRGGNTDTSSYRSRQYSLPDASRDEVRDFGSSSTSEVNEREFGGTRM